MTVVKQEDIPAISIELCNKMLGDLERAKRPLIKAVKCSLDNSFYNHKVGYLEPGNKEVRTELNVSSVKKH